MEQYNGKKLLVDQIEDELYSPYNKKQMVDIF